MTKREVNLILGSLRHCETHTARESEAEETVRWVAATLGDLLWSAGAINRDAQRRFVEVEASR